MKFQDNVNKRNLIITKLENKNDKYDTTKILYRDEVLHNSFLPYSGYAYFENGKPTLNYCIVANYTSLVLSGFLPKKLSLDNSLKIESEKIDSADKSRLLIMGAPPCLYRNSANQNLYIFRKYTDSSDQIQINIYDSEMNFLSSKSLYDLMNLEFAAKDSIISSGYIEKIKISECADGSYLLTFIDNVKKSSSANELQATIIVKLDNNFKALWQKNSTDLFDGYYKYADFALSKDYAYICGQNAETRENGFNNIFVSKIRLQDGAQISSKLVSSCEYAFVNSINYCNDTNIIISGYYKKKNDNKYYTKGYGLNLDYNLNTKWEIIGNNENTQNSTLFNAIALEKNKYLFYGNEGKNLLIWNVEYKESSVEINSNDGSINIAFINDKIEVFFKNKLSENTKYELYSMSGELVDKGEFNIIAHNASIDTRSINSGAYLLRIITPSIIYTGKVLIK
jgi:hypothetical protein